MVRNNEMYKLINALISAGIPFEVGPDVCDTVQIWYPNRANSEADVVCHKYSSGGAEGLLEVMGSLSYQQDDNVEGYLTAEVVFQRMVLEDCRHKLRKGV